MAKRRTQKRRGRLFILSAPSGCGKTTVQTRLLRAKRNLKRSISATTRPPRRGERNRRDYFFISEVAFKKQRRDGAFLEWARTFGYYYATPREFVEGIRRSGRDALLSIDVKGAAQVKKQCPETITIFLMPPSMKELKKRLSKRGTESETERRKRLKVARWEISRARTYDYIVVNETISSAISQLKEIIEGVDRQ
ncbi:MAG: guanylate kinase [Candidatus Omnitrophica bacterium]|nr:guanylate kinase [Candidatus Omnitrophota bacterium]